MHGSATTVVVRNLISIHFGLDCKEIRKSFRTLFSQRVVRLIRCAKKSQTIGAYTKCTGTSGSGAATGTVIIPEARLAIPVDHGMARIALPEAAVFASVPQCAGRRSVAKPNRRAGAATSASALL